MKLTKEDYMKLGLERCAELLVEMQEDDIPTTYTYRTCPYTLRMCYGGWMRCDDCIYNPHVRYATISKED